MTKGASAPFFCAYTFDTSYLSPRAHVRVGLDAI